MSNVTLSIIIPCYNMAKYLEGLFKCLDTQWDERDDYEIIFVNDGSTDDTLSILQGYVTQDTRHRILISQENQGVSAARNAGLDTARGEWIGFLDPDDLLVHGAYAFILDKFADDTIDLLSTQIVMVNKGADLNLKRDLMGNIIFEGNSTEWLSENKLIAFTTCLIRKSVLNSKNIRFNSSISYGEDNLFISECLAQNIRLKILDTVSQFYVQRHESATHSSNKIKQKKYIESLFKCINETQKTETEQIKLHLYLHLYALNIAQLQIRNDISIAEAKRNRDNLKKLGVIPCQALGKTEKIFFFTLLHPWALPIASPLYKLNKKFKTLM